MVIMGCRMKLGQMSVTLALGSGTYVTLHFVAGVYLEYRTLPRVSTLET
jgi:hypothetical protein